MRFYIRDEDDSPQRFPLQKLLRVACAQLAISPEASCELLAHWGYGERIHELGSGLRSDEPVVLSVRELDELVEGKEEWFYDLEACLPERDFRFGLHDSTVMFVEGDPKDAAAVAAVFRDSFADPP
jgi:hypothetical protein